MTLKIAKIIFLLIITVLVSIVPVFGQEGEVTCVSKGWEDGVSADMPDGFTEACTGLNGCSGTQAVEQCADPCEDEACGAGVADGDTRPRGTEGCVCARDTTTTTVPTVPQTPPTPPQQQSPQPTTPQQDTGTSTDSPKKSNLIIDCSFGETGKEQCGIEHLFQLANNIMRLLLWLAITGAGILIFYRGAILAINVFVKGGDQDARKKVQDALKAVLWGLVFILSAYLIVKAGFNIVGYNLGNPFQWNEAALPDVGAPETTTTRRTPVQQPTDDDSDDDTEPQRTAAPAGTTLSVDRDAPTDTCRRCEVDTADARLSSVNFKPIGELCTSNQNRAGNAWNNTNKCWVSVEVGEKLINLARASNASWRVTEACPPSAKIVGNALVSIHSNPCHEKDNCTCVDANFTTTDPSPANIVAFIVAAKNNGFKAVYEVKDEVRYSTLANAVITGLRNEGFSESEARKRIDHISAITTDHFSLYSR